MRIRSEHVYMLGVVCIVLLMCLYFLNKRRTEGFTSTDVPFVTFIIPSVGRDTIDMSLTSLVRQTDPNWRAIVVYDGVSDKSPTITDDRISILRTKQGSAGATRNFGIQRIETPWTAFLDDDDAIAPNYIELLKATIEEEPDMDLLVFRAQVLYGIVHPKTNDNKFKYQRVGIHFAGKTPIIKKYPFEPIYAEDFNFLKNAINNGYNVIQSEHVTYDVRPQLDNVKSDEYWKKMQETYRMKRIRIIGTYGEPEIKG